VARPASNIIEPASPDAGGWIRRLWPFLAVHRRNIMLALAFSVSGMIVTALTPVVEKVIVDRVITGHQGRLWPWLTILLVAGVFGFGMAYVRRFVGGRVALDVQLDLRNAIYERLQRLDLASHDELSTGQLVSRASSDVGLLQGMLSLLPITAGNVVMVVVSLVVMVILSPLLTVVALVATPALAWVALSLRTKVFPATWDAQQRAGDVAQVVDEAVTGVRVVKGFGQEDRALADLTAAAGGLYRSRVRNVRVQARYTPALQAVPVLAQVATLALGGWMAIHGRITLGTFLAFSSYLVQLVAPIRMMAALIAVGQQARAGAERVLELLDSNPRVVDPPEPEPLVQAASRNGTASTSADALGAVVFDDVSFGYLRSEPVLCGFSLRLAAGERVAIVGASGSGKSTVALLLPRFYDVQHGAVTLDGVDVRKLALVDLRRAVGVVFEESFLFSDSVRANIAYGRPDASDVEVEAAARVAAAHEFIIALPHGYDTQVGERGLTLSGGQRQRVALARAVLTDPRVLILDDATSSVDAVTEQDIQDALVKVMEHRTTLLVAHRRSTLRLADRIVVVEAGRIVASGSHEELLADSPLYRALLAGPGDTLEADPKLDDEQPVATVGGITPSAWPQVGETDGAGERVLAPGAIGPPGGGGSGGGGGWGMALAATPELLATLATLPPADDQADIDVVEEAEADPRFQLRRYLSRYRRPLGIGFGLVALDTLLTLAGPLLVRRGIDQGVTRRSTSALYGASIAFLAVALVDWAVTWTYTRQTGRTAERLLYALRIRIFAHLQRMSVDYYDREMAGRIMTRMTTDVEALSQLLQTGLINAIVSILSFVGVLGLLAFIDWRLLLAVLSVVPPLLVATWWFRRASSRAYDRARDRIAAVNADLQESLSGVRVAQAYVREERNAHSFRQLGGEYLDARLDAQRLVALYFPFVLFLSAVADVIVLGVGSRLVQGGTLTAGALIAFILYLDQFFSPIQQLSQVFDTWQQARASTVRIDELMATPTSVPPSDHPAPVAVSGAIRFEHVHFRYAGAVDEALRGFDLDVRAGQTVALVGETGAGKSTIVKLVARFHDPTAGRLLIDGVPLTDIDLGAYRRRLGYVPQEPFLFSGTMRDNIAYGRPSATDAEVEAAARAVGAHDVIVALPGGYRYRVTERGRSLSSGQRQLVCLARAHLVDPAILLLDEATANLDLATEASVQQAMGVVAAGRTTLLVAHRLQTARNADCIVVIADGRIAEIGTHDQLLASGSSYAALWGVLAV
jgi:ATP-binding cassette subfamily B protein